jgi:DNA-binding transcriptional regulator YiaG
MPAPRNREEFAALVNDARRRQYLSIRAVARVAQVPATTIQGWLDGRHFPSPALRPNYLLLVNHLGLDDQVPDDIWDDSRA